MGVTGALLLLLGVATTCFAELAPVQIFYDIDSLGDNHWQYTYTVKNNSLTHIDSGYGEIGVTYFNVYFPADSSNPTSESALFTNLAVAYVYDPTKWDVFVQGPTSDIPRPVWKFDAYATPPEGDYQVIYPVLAGQSAGPFSVNFDYTGSGTPGNQQFAVLELGANQVIFEGTTQPHAVPLPPSIALLVTGVLGLAMLKRFRRRF